MNRLEKLVVWIVIPTFLWPNIIWADEGSFLAPASSGVAALVPLAEAQLAVKQMCKAGRLAGVPCLVFSDRKDPKKLAYYVYNSGEPYFSRITNHKDVDDHLWRVLQYDVVRISGEDIEFTIDEERYYQQVFRVRDKGLEFINACFRIVFPEQQIGYEEYDGPLPLGKVYSDIIKRKIVESNSANDAAMDVLRRLGLIEISGLHDEAVDCKVLSVFDNTWHSKDIPDIASELLRVLEDRKEIISRLRAVIILYKEVIPLVMALRLKDEEKEELIRIAEDSANPGVLLYLLKIASGEGIDFAGLKKTVVEGPAAAIFAEATALWSISPYGVEDVSDEFVHRAIYDAKERVNTETGRAILYNLIEYWKRNIIIHGKDIEARTTVYIQDMPGKVPLYLIVKIGFYYWGEKIAEGTVDIDLSAESMDIKHMKIIKKGYGLESEVQDRLYLTTQLISSLFGIKIDYERRIEHFDRKAVLESVLSGLREYINSHGEITPKMARVIGKVYLNLLSADPNLLQPKKDVHFLTTEQEGVPRLDIGDMFKDGGYSTEFNPLYIWEQYFSMLGNSIDVKFVFRLGDSVRVFTVRLPKRSDRVAGNFIFAYLYNLMVSRGADRIGVYAEDEAYTDRLVRRLSHRFPLKEKLDRNGKPGYTHIRPVLEEVYGRKVEFYKSSKEEVEGIEHPNVNVIAETNLPMLHTLKTTKGIIAGIDAGGTDIKVVIYKGNRLVYAKEHNWAPGSFANAEKHIGTVEKLIRLCLIKIRIDEVMDRDLDMELEELSDSRTGIERIGEFIAKAEARLGRDFYNRLEAVGISWPEVVVRDRMVPFSGKVDGLKKLRLPQREEELGKIAGLRDEISRRFGNIPVAIANDGNIGAFWGAVELGKGNLMGISMGTSCGVGYIDREGRITEMFKDMGKVVMNLTDDSLTMHVSTGITGVSQRHLSQDGVFRAADRLGLDISNNKVSIFVAREYARRFRIDLADISEDEVARYVYERLPEEIQREFAASLIDKNERLRYIQSLLDSPDGAIRAKAEEVFKEIGRYLACFIAQVYLYFDESGTRNIVLFGRVIRGSAGEIIIRTAREFIRDRFPWLPDINMHLAHEITDNPDADRFGQAQGAVYLGYKKLLEERIYGLIKELDRRGIAARINRKVLSEIESPEMLLKHIVDYTPLKNPEDIINILESRLSDRDIFLFNAIFNQEELLRGLDRPINIVMFRGGRGVGELTRLMKDMPNINISTVLGGTDDGRSWYHAAQDFDATGVPDCGKTLLDLARDREVARFLETRLKGEEKVLKARINQLIGEGIPGIKPEKSQWIVRYLKEFMDRLEEDFPRSSFSLNNIPIRSIVLVGAAWYYGGNWQRAIDEVAGLLDVKPGGRVTFSTFGRVHLVGLTEDGTIYFTETGINEHPKKSDFLGLWLFGKKPDIEEVADLLKKEGIDLESVEIPQGMPSELAREVFETSRRIRQRGKIEDAAVILSGLSYSEVGDIIVNPVAMDVIQSADIIVYGPSSLESNIGSGLLPGAIQGAVKRNTDAVKIFFVNPTVENEPRGITAYDVLEKLYRYITRQQFYRVGDVTWEGGYIDFILGRGLQYKPMDPRKRYIPFDDRVIEDSTGSRVTAVGLNLEWEKSILKERRDYGGYQREYGFYSPQVMLENIIALWALNRQEHKVARIEEELFQYEERAGMGLIDKGLISNLMLLRYSESQEIRRKALKILRYTKDKGYIQNDEFKEIERLFLERDIEDDIGRINNLLRDNRQFVIDTFRNLFNRDISQSEMDDSEVKIRYLGRGSNKQIYKIEWRIPAGEVYKFVISTIRDAQLEQGDFKKDEIDSAVNGWEELSKRDIPHVARFGARAWVSGVSHMIKKGERIFMGIEDNVLIASRQFIDGITLAEALASADIPDEEKDKIRLTALDAFLDIWRLSKDKNGKGMFVMPCADDIIVFRSPGGEWRAKVIDLDLLETDVDTKRIMQILSLYSWIPVNAGELLYKAVPHGLHIVRKAEGGKERLIYSFQLKEEWPEFLYRTQLRDALARLEHIYGPGITTQITKIQIVENLGGGGLYLDGRAPLASYKDGVLKIDELAFKYGEHLLFEELEHEFLESIAVLIPGATYALADVVSTFRNVKRFLELGADEKERFLDFLGDENPIDPDGEYLALLRRLSGIRDVTEDEIIASVVRYALRTKLYEKVRDELGLPDELARKIRDLEPRLDDALAVFNEIKKATGLVEKVKESSELAISVIKTFNGIRVQGLDKIDKKLAEIITVLVKIASKTDVIAARSLPMTDGRYYIVVDKDRITEEMRDAIKGLEKNDVFKVVYEVPGDYDPKKIIHLIDPGDLREGMQEGILYLPMPYLRSSLYMAAMVVIAGGEVARIDPLIKGLIVDLYKITDEELIDLFNAPWRLLPKIQGVISELNKLQGALAEIEKAA